MKFVMVTILAMMTFGGALAQTSAPELPAPPAANIPASEYPDFKDVAGELRCPTCNGLSVLDSSAPFSEQIKTQVREQLAAGKSHEQILAFFVDRYGPWILRAPPKTGVNLLAWLVPLLLLCLGPPLLWLTMWRRRHVVATLGVRSSAEIEQEFFSKVEELRNSARKGV